MADIAGNHGNNVLRRHRIKMTCDLRECKFIIRRCFVYSVSLSKQHNVLNNCFCKSVLCYTCGLRQWKRNRLPVFLCGTAAIVSQHNTSTLTAHCLQRLCDRKTARKAYSMCESGPWLYPSPLCPAFAGDDNDDHCPLNEIHR